LELELSGAAFGKNATASFKIPAKTIAETIAEKPMAVKLTPAASGAKKKPREPKPGTPEYDFGLEQDDGEPRH
jgi:hypothetical protein